MSHSTFAVITTIFPILFFMACAQGVEVLVWMHNDATRIMGNNYDRTYKAIYVRDGCPPAVNDFHCPDFVIFAGDCPVYECNGVIKREPCNSGADCGPDGICEDYICTYPAELFGR